jgi:hypothetical protein
MSSCSDRSYEPLTKDDLKQLADKVIERLNEQNKPVASLGCVVLSQNGARHYLNSVNGTPNQAPGIHDFDIIAFFTEGLAHETGPRPLKTKSGLKKFGYCKECGASEGETRKVDIFCRKLKLEDMDVRKSVERFFSEGDTHWIKLIGERPCIGIFPNELLGEILWTGVKRT